MRCGGVSLRALSAEGVKPRCATNDLATLPDRTPLDQSKTETCSHWAGPVARAHRLWNVRSLPLSARLRGWLLIPARSGTGLRRRPWLRPGTRPAEPAGASVCACPDDCWEELADAFTEGAYATVKGRVRTYVLHEQLLRHMPAPPATVLDVGGGAAHQSLPLARLGYEVTLVDPSAAMLAKATQRLATDPEQVQRRVRLIRAEGQNAPEAVDSQTFNAVLCHGVLMYLAQPDPMVDSLCRCL